MRLMFLTFAPLSSNAGHLARFVSVLSDLAKLNDISIVCLGASPDGEETLNKYRNVSFFHLPTRFDGWKVMNISELKIEVLNLIKKIKPDLVVLQMEVWDLIKELNQILKGQTKFAAVLHAIPFVVSPLESTGDFELDVQKYINSDIEEFRKDYIRSHYKEAKQILGNTEIIVYNNTVPHYLNIYFKNLSIWRFDSNVSMKKKVVANMEENPVWDFVYMARMETGKGIEYLDQILTEISSLLSREISLVILGRMDDSFSREALTELLNNSGTGSYKIDYLGWADESRKINVLPKSGVFLYPSHYDTYAMVLGEALSFGLPIIVWDVPFISLNYKNTKAMKRVPLFNFHKFAVAATEYLSERNLFIETAVNYAESFDTTIKVAQKDTEMYQRIVKNNE